VIEVAFPGKSRRQTAIDVALVAIAFLLGLALLGGDDRGGDRPDVDGLAVLLVALTALPLFWRRSRPLAVFALTATASAAINALGYPAGPPIGPTIAIFSLGLYPSSSRAGLRLSAAVVVLLLGVHLVATGVGDEEIPIAPALFGILVWGGAWVIGDRVRMRRERSHQAEADAARELRLAVAEERTRIARDLHDSAGHALNVILVEAGAARLLAQKDPVRARTAIATIEDVARETVGEIDRLVHVLREDGAGRAVAPPIGLAALETLVSRHRATGLEVDLSVRGDARPLTRAVDQAAYRIVQEALTNAGRHGGDRAQVELVYGERALELTIDNPLRPGRPPGEPRHGIVGMRERATLLRGSLEAGAHEGRFRVHAELPYGDAQ
jgi:signal transduction histidine kinase